MERGRSKGNGRAARYPREERQDRELKSFPREDRPVFQQNHGLDGAYPEVENRYNNAGEYCGEKYDREEYGREARSGGKAGNNEGVRYRPAKDNPYQRLFAYPGKERYRSCRRSFEDDQDSLELIRERFPVSYRRAKEVLDLVGGEVKEAINYLEREVKEAVDNAGEAVERTSDYLLARGDDVVERGEEINDQFQGFWHWANNRTVTVRRGEEVMARIPATLGLMGLATTLFSSRLALVGAIGLAGILSSGYNLELDDNRQDI